MFLCFDCYWCDVQLVQQVSRLKQTFPKKIQVSLAKWNNFIEEAAKMEKNLCGEAVLVPWCCRLYRSKKSHKREDPLDTFFFFLKKYIYIFFHIYRHFCIHMILYILWKHTYLYIYISFKLYIIYIYIFFFLFMVREQPY